MGRSRRVGDSGQEWISPEEEQHRASRDLSFHGWRDWLLVILGVPLFVVIIVAAARIGIGSMGEAPFPVPWEIVAAAVVLALAAGLLWKRRARRSTPYVVAALLASTSLA